MSTLAQPIDGYPPTSLLLYLQSAPPPLIFMAFQADCTARGIQWYTTEGQIFAVNLFLKHPVSHRYPPRPTTLRSFLKQYISLIEQPHIMSKVMEANGGLEDPIQIELMEALIALNMTRNDTESTTCYKSFFNPYLERNIRRASSTALSISNSDMGVDVASSFSAPLTKREREKLRRERRETMSMFCPIRVSAEQFRNVGLSLWPAAFVLVQLLAQELKGTSHLLTEYLFPNRVDWDVVSDASSNSSSDDADDAVLVEGIEDDETAGAANVAGGRTAQAKRDKPGAAAVPSAAPSAPAVVPSKEGAARVARTLSASGDTSSSTIPTHTGVSLLARAGSASPLPALNVKRVPEKEKLHLLELGAGVGLTPILLHRIRSYRDYVANFTITDYQATLTDNISFNLKTNKVSVVGDYDAAAHGLEGTDATPPYHLVSLLDWNDDEMTQQSQLLSWRSDVVLAADCIYDVDVVPGLVKTIKTALTMRYTMPSSTTRSSGLYTDTSMVTTTTTNAAAANEGASGAGPFAAAIPPAPPRGAPQRRLSRHGMSGLHSLERKKSSDVDKKNINVPYDPLVLSSTDSANASLVLDASYDFGIDLSSSSVQEGPSGTRSQPDNTRSPSLRSPMHSTSSFHDTTRPPAAPAHAVLPSRVAPSGLASSSPAAGSAPTGTQPRRRVCIVVQTHRQASTMKTFFDAVRAFARVESYVLERMPVLQLESQLSKGRDCRDGGVVPIGDYNPNQAESVFENRDRWVCALRPDVVLPDGNLQSVVTKAKADLKTGAHGLVTSANAETASWQGSLGTNSTSGQGSGGTAGATWSAVNSFSAFTSADVDALLKDEMIGPFFTSMAGLIGVHVITLKD